jgi:raffinose synthase
VQVLSGVGVVDGVDKLFDEMHSYLAGAPSLGSLLHCGRLAAAAPCLCCLHAMTMRAAGAGINGVKVDCQSTLDMIGAAPSMGGGSALSARYHRALEASVAKHFPGNNCINCMCHSTNDLYRCDPRQCVQAAELVAAPGCAGPLICDTVRMEDTALARSSDDFWPRDTASHTTHIAVNAGNSVFIGALLQPDWDMFHSKHPAALLHATARVVRVAQPACVAWPGSACGAQPC